MSALRKRDELLDGRQEILIPGGLGAALLVKAGDLFEVVDVEGQQVADFIAFAERNRAEWLSTTPTPDRPRCVSTCASETSCRPTGATRCSKSCATMSATTTSSPQCAMSGATDWTTASRAIAAAERTALGHKRVADARPRQPLPECADQARPHVRQRAPDQQGRRFDLVRGPYGPDRRGLRLPARPESLQRLQPDPDPPPHPALSGAQRFAINCLAPRTGLGVSYTAAVRGVSFGPPIHMAGVMWRSRSMQGGQTSRQGRDSHSCPARRRSVRGPRSLSDRVNA
jgi:hypothetical protein